MTLNSTTRTPTRPGTTPTAMAPSSKYNEHRSQAVVRTIKLAILLCRRGYTVAELRDSDTYTGFSDKTVWRDLRALEDANIPVYCENVDEIRRDVAGIYRVDPHWLRPYV